MSATLVEPMAHDLVIDVEKEVDHVILRPRGELSLRTIPRVREAAVKALLGTGRVLIDLSRVCSTRTALVTVFPAALAAAGGWPAARLVLFGADATTCATLVSSRVTETVHLATDLPSARALLEQRPRQLQRHHDLPRHNTAPVAARLFVRDICAAWEVPRSIQEIAELLSSELVSNAVEHARSASRLTITCTRSTLRVSVRDYCPAPIPRPRPIEVGALRGRGLHFVAALTQGWGTNQHPDGKTIWANIRIDVPAETGNTGPEDHR
jgi:anti-sigma regulatory factor (Ser/Thr protein kinase)/anti-anti-sigma regulatory factor